MSVIRWEDPPAEHGNKKPPKPLKYQPVADALRSRPGVWAVVAENRPHGSAGSLAHSIRNGGPAWHPTGAFDAKVIGSPGSTARVYARYVGPGSTSPAAGPRVELNGVDVTEFVKPVELNPDATPRRRPLADPNFNPAYRVARCGQSSAHGPHVMEHGPDQPRNCPGTGRTAEEWAAQHAAEPTKGGTE